MGTANAASLAACYGSVSAMTYLAAAHLLEDSGISFHGHMTAVMALMEIPAIIIAIAIYKGTGLKILQILKNKSVILLLSGFVIGLFLPETAQKKSDYFTNELFKIVLTLFLFDLGLKAQKQSAVLKKYKRLAVLLGIVWPIFAGTSVFFAISLFPVNAGDQILLAVLAGSASYIAAPAAIRMNIPEAEPSFYMGLPLAITFPLNIILGLEWYVFLSRLVHGN